MGFKVNADQINPGLPNIPDGFLELEKDVYPEGDKDPWKHRSKGMSCSTCMYYVKKKSDAPKEIGRCRRNAPTMKGFPAVFPNDWCGDHKIDEEKL